MTLFEKLQKLASSSAALRTAHLKKEAGFGTALMGTGKSIANKAANHFAGQVNKHGLLVAGLGTAMGLGTLAEIPGAMSKTYKAGKSGFDPALHKAELGIQ